MCRGLLGGDRPLGSGVVPRSGVLSAYGDPVENGLPRVDSAWARPSASGVLSPGPLAREGQVRGLRMSRVKAWRPSGRRRRGR